MKRAGEGYALDLHTAVRHVATAMDTAGGWVSIAVMAATYAGASAGDLSRVRLHHRLKTDSEAIEFLVRSAVGELGDQVEGDGDNCRLAVSFGDLRYDGRPVHREHDPYKRLGDLFNPMLHGNLSDDIRSAAAAGTETAARTDAELRASMKALGWLPELPGVVDERGVIIIGHRRAAIAAELGIKPVLAPVTFGRGDEADIKRLRLAWASNTGRKALAPQDRRKISAHLSETRDGSDWTQEDIAEALRTASSRIKSDLVSNQADTEREQRYHNGGRTRNRRQTAHEAEIEEMVPAAVEALMEGRNRGDVAGDFGLPNNSMKVAEAFGVARERLANLAAMQDEGECRHCLVHYCPP